jgi:hypothetical protein
MSLSRDRKYGIKNYCAGKEQQQFTRPTDRPVHPRNCCWLYILLSIFSTALKDPNQETRMFPLVTFPVCKFWSFHGGYCSDVAFWADNVKTCRGYRLFGETRCFHLQDGRLWQTINQHECGRKGLNLDGLSEDTGYIFLRQIRELESDYVGVLRSLWISKGNLVSSRQCCSSQGGHYTPKIGRYSR